MPMAATMDEQTMRTIISIQRQKLADLEWQNVQLQAEIIRMNSEPGRVDDNPKEFHEAEPGR